MINNLENKNINCNFASKMQFSDEHAVFCPQCEKKGHKSRLPISDLKGSVKVWCKHCKQEIEIGIK